MSDSESVTLAFGDVVQFGETDPTNEELNGMG